MKKYNTSYRLKQILAERNLKQVDVLRLAAPYCEKFGVKLNKNDLSQYVSGKVEPGQNKLYILGLALNVNEAWLMGYDVPMDKFDFNYSDSSQLSLSPHETNVITAYRNKPEMQPAVDRLLDIDSEEETVQIATAARTIDNRNSIEQTQVIRKSLEIFDIAPQSDEDL